MSVIFENSSLFSFLFDDLKYVVKFDNDRKKFVNSLFFFETKCKVKYGSKDIFKCFLVWLKKIWLFKIWPMREVNFSNLSWYDPTFISDHKFFILRKSRNHLSSVHPKDTLTCTLKGWFFLKSFLKIVKKPNKFFLIKYRKQKYDFWERR